MSAIEEITTLEAFAIENNIDPDLLQAFADNEHLTDPEEALALFQDNYLGTHDSLEAWAEDWMEQTGELNEIPERLRYYFDYGLYARDCQLGGDIFTLDHDGMTAVFWNR